MRRFACLAFVLLFLPACQTARGPAPSSADFRAQDAAYVHKRGAGQIEGQAFIVLPNGQTRLAAGETVRLVPATAYARARIAHFYGSRKFIRARDIPQVPVDPEYVANTRATVSTSSGGFRFEGVAPGDYFVVTQKIYRGEGALFPEGGAMYEAVRVSGSETARVVIVGR